MVQEKFVEQVLREEISIFKIIPNIYIPNCEKKFDYFQRHLNFLQFYNYKKKVPLLSHSLLEKN